MSLSALSLLSSKMIGWNSVILLSTSFFLLLPFLSLSLCLELALLQNDWMEFYYFIINFLLTSIHHFWNGVLTRTFHEY
jgi:hypothetical protein